MAQSGAYKQYTRTQRNTILEESFAGGMCTDDIPLTDGTYKHLVNFQIIEEGKQLVPRRGKIPDETFSQTVESACALFTPPTETTTLGVYNVRYDAFTGATGYDADLIETVRKFIIACPNESKAQRSAEGSLYHEEYTTMSDGKQLACYYLQKETAPIFIASMDEIKAVAPYTDHAPGSFLKVVEGPRDNTTSDVKISVLSELAKFRPMPRLVGSAIKNTFYTIGGTTSGSTFTRGFKRIAPCPTTNRTYYVEDVTPKALDPVYANSYGFNMLSSTPYTFVNSAGAWELNGLLPYEDSACAKISFSYITGQKIYFKTYFNYTVSSTIDYKIQKKLNSEDTWTDVTSGSLTSLADSCPDLIFNISIPNEAFSIRVTFYTSGSTTDVKSSNDYSFSGGSETEDTYGSTQGLDMITYDLTTATGMLTWKSKLVLWGVDKAPDMIFTSDYNNPTYFPYPNGCESYPDNILHVCIFMDSLLVFTSESIYKTTLSDDGLSFNTETVVADVRLTYEDTYSIVPVKNMLFYKSDNYYYMLVPSSKSLTYGELNVAPVSKPINHMLDHFDTELKQVLSDMYGAEWNYPELEDITLTPNTYQVYLANNEVCIDYRFKISISGQFNNLSIAYVLKYNTVLRTWSADLYYTPYSSIQMYNKNIAGVPRYIMYIHDVGSEEAIAIYIDVHALHVINDDEEVFTIDEHTAEIASIERFSVSGHTFDLGENDSTYKIKPKILTESIDGTVDTYLTTDYLPNKQFIDTGYRNLNIINKKRMREIQFKINDKLAVPLEFKTGFIMDNRRRVNIGSYVLTPTDDNSLTIVSNANTLKVHGTAGQIRLNDDDDPDTNDNVFSLGNADLALHDVATVRWKVSGKGYLPRLTMLSANTKAYELTGICWIARQMNAR